MKFLSMLTVCLVVSAMAWAGTDAAAQGDTYTKEILAHLAHKQYRQAVADTIRYEQTMLGMYPAATYTHGQFQSEADHLSFTSAFPEWKESADVELLNFAQSSGTKLLLVTRGTDYDDRLAVLCFNGTNLFARLGPEEGAADSPFTSAQFRMVTDQFASSFGIVNAMTEGTVGNDATLECEIDTPIAEPFTGLISLMHGKRVYFFLMTSSSYSDFEEKMAALRTTVASVAFTYKPTDAKQIAKIRAQFAGKDSPTATLDMVEMLAAIGEYNTAADTLSQLCQTLFAQIPQPVVSKSAIDDTAYDVKLTNPDPKKWALETVNEGGLRGMFLRNMNSPTPDGLFVFIIDALMTTGTESGNPTDPEAKKAMLQGTGRGMLVNFCDDIAQEEFTTVKGGVAYEATAQATKFENGKVHSVVTYQDDYFLGILVVTDSTKFDSKMKVYHDIIASYLSVK